MTVTIEDIHKINSIRQDTHDSTKTIMPTNSPSRDHFYSTSDTSSPSSPQPTQPLRLLESPPILYNDYYSQPDTPANRTGPPRSLSFAYSMPNSPSAVRPPLNGFLGYADQQTPESALDDPDLSFSNAGSEFRSALDISSLQDRKGKRRERSDNTKTWSDDTWNPRKWFQETPKEEKHTADFLGSPVLSPQPTAVTDSPVEQPDIPSPMYTSEPESSTLPRSAKRGASAHESDPPNSAKTSVLRRAFSVPHSRFEGESSKDKSTQRHSGEKSARWGRLRSLIPHIIQTQNTIVAEPSAIAPPTVNITDELITGGLSTLMLRLWFERDEKGHRRIPVLFHRLRIRISDSIHPLQDKTIFRIECEYANAVRWVVYRELKDFFSLHTHYTVSNVYNRNVDKMPEFPKTSTSFHYTYI